LPLPLTLLAPTAFDVETEPAGFVTALLGVAGFNRNVSESSRLARLRRLLLNCAPDAEAFSYLRAIVKKLAANSKSA